MSYGMANTIYFVNLFTLYLYFIVSAWTLLAYDWFFLSEKVTVKGVFIEETIVRASRITVTKEIQMEILSI